MIKSKNPPRFLRDPARSGHVLAMILPWSCPHLAMLLHLVKIVSCTRDLVWYCYDLAMILSCSCHDLVMILSWSCNALAPCQDLVMVLLWSYHDLARISCILTRSCHDFLKTLQILARYCQGLAIIVIWLYTMILYLTSPNGPFPYSTNFWIRKTN